MDAPAGHSESEDVAVQLADGPVSAPATPPAPASAPDAAETTEEEQLRHDEDGGGSVRKVEGEYAAQDYSHLDVSAEVRDLFQYISQYSAHDAELESTLKPFVPDYLPAVGQMDVFVKVQRPDGERDELGLRVLDEPALPTTNPSAHVELPQRDPEAASEETSSAPTDDADV